MREGREGFPSLIILCWYAPTKLFLLGLFFAVMLCFIGGKWPTQIADEIAQVFRKVINAHLIEVIVSLFIGHDHQTQYFFTGQGSRVVRFLGCPSILSVNVGEIPLTRLLETHDGMLRCRG